MRGLLIMLARKYKLRHVDVVLAMRYFYPAKPELLEWLGSVPWYEIKHDEPRIKPKLKIKMANGFITANAGDYITQNSKGVFCTYSYIEFINKYILA